MRAKALSRLKAVDPRIQPLTRLININMAENVSQLKQVAPDFHIRRGSVKSTSGLRVQKVARAIYDTALTDSAGVSNKTVAAHGLGVYIPAKAFITRSWYQVVTGFTSAANTATIAVSVEGANDVKTATAVSDASFSGAGFNEGIQDGTATHFVQASVEREIVATVAVQALTAGKLILHIEYNLGE